MEDCRCAVFNDTSTSTGRSGSMRLAEQQRGGRRYWIASVALLVLLAAGFIIWRATTGSSIYRDGLSEAAPSPLQLAAMGYWYEHHEGRGEFGDPGDKVGCVVYPMATTGVSHLILIAYTQTMCQECPPGESGGETAVVFRMRSTSVESVQAATEIGGTSQIERYFPHQLWDKAEASIPDPDLYLEAAYQVANC